MVRKPTTQNLSRSLTDDEALISAACMPVLSISKFQAYCTVFAFEIVIDKSIRHRMEPTNEPLRLRSIGNLKFMDIY